jgi:hypothetical protein
MRKRAGTNAQEVHLLRLEELEPVARVSLQLRGGGGGAVVSTRVPKTTMGNKNDFSTSAFQIASFMSFPLYSLITWQAGPVRRTQTG